ncbi:MAG: NAD-dependent dihydropyrimidine dehydrogenase subunit PreA [Candidatus Melainabacteria bacterium]|nr:NAD-dependent dihydropyrimidine dehydrogenase subunit PreA [Candidatus Melainabacteria bacterium]MBI3309316.1 NAD-dependent dihydropyrimidine dehydrogenase subunit PreA [Candidatus Melainabacteria bacterium]
MANLECNFAGIKSPNPFWLASGPPANTAYQVINAFKAGWGGAVWKTLGVPIVNVSSRYGAMSYKNEKIAGFNNIELITDRSLEDNLKDMKEVKEKFPNHALIASMMFEKKEEWHDCIKKCEDIGVDGFELNYGCPHGMCERGMGSAVGQNPDVCEKITSWVMEVAKKPVIVKLTPNITDITKAGLAAQRGGANAVSLINTINSVTGIDLDTMEPNPKVAGLSSHGGYCGPAVKPIALNMIAELTNHPDFHLPISGIGGIETWRDAAEHILMGASTVQVCTAVMHYGFKIVQDMTEGLSNYLDSQKMKSVLELSGITAKKLRKWEDLDLNYKIIASIDEEKCIGCQLCYIACEDGAHQAIALLKNSRVPKIKEDHCVGCNLCSLVCPVESCISMINVTTNKQKLIWKEHPKNPINIAIGTSLKR